MAKSNNRPIYDGHQMRSNQELAFYQLLEQKKLKGEIHDFEYEPPAFLLNEEYIDFRGKKIAKITHIIDFKVNITHEECIYVDVKGGIMHEADAKLKRKMWEQKYPGLSYYWISQLPGYMGKLWVESSPYYDFYSKLYTRYKKRHPVESKLNWRKKTLQYDSTVWTQDFEFGDMCGCFYIWTKTLKMKLIKRSD